MTTKYRYITVGARVAPLATILTPAYAQGVRAESLLAESAPDLLAALRFILTASRKADAGEALRLIQAKAREAIFDATEPEDDEAVQS